MNRDELRSVQAPFKARYQETPEAALVTLRSEGEIGEGIACSVRTSRALVEAGLHPATGGSGLQACSGDMLLDALVACAGVTLSAVATALEIEVRRGRVIATGEIDMRGTLGVDRQAPIGFKTIALHFELETDASAEQIQSLLKLTERYCVIYQTLRQPPVLSVAHALV